MLYSTRRTLLGAATLAGLSLPAIIRAQGKEPIRIGSALAVDRVAGRLRQGLRHQHADGREGRERRRRHRGRPVEIVALDTQADPQLGINAANRFIGVEKLPMFFVSWSAVVKALAPIANREKVLAMNNGANSPEIAHLGDYVYTTFPLADVDVTKLARYMYHDAGQAARGGAVYQQRYRHRRGENVSRHVHRGRRPGRGVRSVRSRKPPNLPACC